MKKNSKFAKIMDKDYKKQQSCQMNNLFDRIDPGLCGITTKILLQSLRECPPLSLRDPTECLDGLGKYKI